jgi:hypothetical protein
MSGPASTDHRLCPTPSRVGRHTRAWLLVLLVVTGAFVAGSLFAKHRLESLRATVLSIAQSRTGARLSVDAIAVTGLRGLRVDNCVASLESPSGPTIDVKIPEVFVYINLFDLLRGEVTIERVQLDQAHIRVSRPPEHRWFAFKGLGVQKSTNGGSQRSFRVVGQDCVFEVDNVVGSTQLKVTDLEFDVARLPGTQEIAAGITGNLAGDAAKALNIELEFTSMEDFQLRLAGSQIAAGDVNVLLPAPRQFVRSGVVDPKITIEGFPDKLLHIALEMPFENLYIRNQPEFFGATTGLLRANASYDGTAHILEVNEARATSDQVNGSVSGSINLAGDIPALDLRVNATSLPLEGIINHLIEGRVEEYGNLVFSVEEPHEFTVALSGTTEEPLVTARANAPGGTVAFSPHQGRLPEVTLAFGRLDAGWDSASRKPHADLVVRSGTVTHAESGFEASDISTTVALKEDSVRLQPLTFTFHGQPILVDATYDIVQRAGTATANGTFTNIEGTKLKTAFKNTELGGSATITAKASFDRGKLAIEDATVNATQTRVDYDWWLRKPEGIGTTVKITGEIRRKEAITLHFEGDVSGSPITAELRIKHDGERFKMKEFSAESKKLNIDTASQLLALPYEISGGSALDVEYVWTRAPEGPPYWNAEAKGVLDSVVLLPDGAKIPLKFKDIEFSTTFDRAKPEKDGDPAVKTGHLIVKRGEAVMPPFGETWFVPMRSDDDDTSGPRDWTYDLTGDYVELPPWKGTRFWAEGHSTREGSGLDHYEAVVDNGRVEGSYRVKKADNSYKSYVKWQEVPASYFIQHLKLPEVLDGPMSGDVEWSMDRDDPGTLDGGGSFELHDGHFNTAVIVGQFGELTQDSGSLPPFLEFSKLDAQVGFTGDEIRTPLLELDASGLEVDGEGKFVSDGDIDYTINIAIAPELAEEFPAFRDSLNVDGYKAAGLRIKLGIELSGPTSEPVTKVVQTPPLIDTATVGILDVGEEVKDLLKTPKNLGETLLKMLGGAAKAGKQKLEGNQ